MIKLEIIYQDSYLVIINKPHGLLVHRSKIADDTSEFALQILRDQLDQHVYPCHRIDRKTSGLLVFALSKEVEIACQKLFQEGLVDKSYLAILRGFAPEEGIIDYPLKKENGQLQEAITKFKRLQKVEIPWALGNHATSRYSLVRAYPQTGRMHQIRKHFAHIFHPIIGDRPHGCNKQNRFFKQIHQLDSMCLHAEYLSFKHPISEEIIKVYAPLQAEFNAYLKLMGLEL
ncbi:MAG: pseudouridylate synthase [Pedobacter sp.]|jgi:tRNA pseudouridine65 synthase|nr:MAG: pseudouridylate synthase [Pedobacter sp.]